MAKQPDKKTNDSHESPATLDSTQQTQPPDAHQDSQKNGRQPPDIQNQAISHAFDLENLAHELDKQSLYMSVKYSTLGRSNSQPRALINARPPPVRKTISHRTGNPPVSRQKTRQTPNKNLEQLHTTDTTEPRRDRTHLEEKTKTPLAIQFFRCLLYTSPSPRDS